MPKYIVNDPRPGSMGRYLANDSTGGVSYQHPDGHEEDVCTWECWVGGQIWELRGFKNGDPFPQMDPYHDTYPATEE